MFEKVISDKIEIEKDKYKTQLFEGENQHFINGFNSGYMFALFEIQDLYRRITNEHRDIQRLD